MANVEQFRVLLEEERDRKHALLKALRQDIGSVSAARENSNVDDEHDPEGSTIAFELSQATALLEQSRAGWTRSRPPWGGYPMALTGCAKFAGQPSRKDAWKRGHGRRSVSGTPPGGPDDTHRAVSAPATPSRL